MIKQLRRGALIAAACLAACASAQAGAQASTVGAALERPALASAQAAHAVLMGAAQAGQRLVAVGERGIIVWSDDAGKQWQQAQVPVSVTLTAVQFVDASHGWAVGHGGVVLASGDGGKSWQRQLDGIAAAQLLLAEATARNDALAIKQANRMVADGADKPLLALHFFDQSRGIVVGAYNLAFATSDGGKTWQPWSSRIDNPQGLHLYTIRAQGASILIAGEQGMVIKSDDQGAHFARIATPYKGSFFTAELLGERDIVLAGLRGNAWRSSDNGANWAALSGAAPVSFTASAMRGAREVLLANQAGQLFSLLDGTLRALPGAPLPPPAGLLPLADGRLLALTARGAILVPAATKVPQ